MSESTYIFYTLIDAYNETVSTLCEFDWPISNIGLLPNFVHLYFQAESATNLVISSYRCTAMVPWCVRGNNVHGSGQISSKKYCHVEEQEDENCHFNF